MSATKTLTHCPSCGVDLPGLAGRSTCGNSYCQEANFYAVVAQNTKSKKAEAARQVAREKLAMAEEMRARREGCR